MAQEQKQDSSAAVRLGRRVSNEGVTIGRLRRLDESLLLPPVLERNEPSSHPHDQPGCRPDWTHHRGSLPWRSFASRAAQRFANCFWSGLEAFAWSLYRDPTALGIIARENYRAGWWYDRLFERHRDAFREACRKELIKAFRSSDGREISGAAWLYLVDFDDADVVFRRDEVLALYPPDFVGPLAYGKVGGSEVCDARPIGKQTDVVDHIASEETDGHFQPGHVVVYSAVILTKDDFFVSSEIDSRWRDAHQAVEEELEAHKSHPGGPAWQNLFNTTEGQREGEDWAKACICRDITGWRKSKIDAVSLTGAGYLEFHKRRDQSGWVMKKIYDRVAKEDEGTIKKYTDRYFSLSLGVDFLLRRFQNGFPARLDAASEDLLRGEMSQELKMSPTALDYVLPRLRAVLKRAARAQSNGSITSRGG